MSENCRCELNVRVLPLDGRKSPAITNADFETLLRDASRQLFGNVSGLIDFDVVDVDGDVVTLNTDKNDVTRLWTALTLCTSPHSLFTVTRTSVIS